MSAAGTEGAAIEIGAGNGFNLEHDPEAVTRLVLASPTGTCAVALASVSTRSTGRHSHAPDQVHPHTIAAMRVTDVGYASAELVELARG